MVIIAENNEDYNVICDRLNIDGNLHTMVSQQNDIYMLPIPVDGVPVVAISDLPNDLTAHDLTEMSWAGYNIVWMTGVSQW